MLRTLHTWPCNTSNDWSDVYVKNACASCFLQYGALCGIAIEDVTCVKRVCLNLKD